MNFSFGDKTYKIFDDSLVDPIYQNYKTNGYNVIKFLATNETSKSDKKSAIMVAGSYTNGKFGPHKPLLASDTVGAVNGSDTSPLFLATGPNPNNTKQTLTYSFIRLSQTLTFTFKVHYIQTWNNYKSYTSTTLYLTKWSSRFPTEGDYICSIKSGGNVNSFTLPAGESSGNLDVSLNVGSFSLLAGGTASVEFKIFSGSTEAQDYNLDFDELKGQDINDKTAIGTDASYVNTVYDWYVPPVWHYETVARWRLTWLDATDKTWKTQLSPEADPVRQSWSEWWSNEAAAGRGYTGLRISFRTIKGEPLVNSTTALPFTYIRTTSKVYGAENGGTASTDWYAYDYSYPKGTSDSTDTVTFSFAYNGD